VPSQGNNCLSRLSQSVVLNAKGKYYSTQDLQFYKAQVSWLYRNTLQHLSSALIQRGNGRLVTEPNLFHATFLLIFTTFLPPLHINISEAKEMHHPKVA
jgi:hypothetical protein